MKDKSSSSLFACIPKEVRTDLLLSNTSDSEKSVRLYVGFSSKLMESKFLDQDVDVHVVSLANRSIVTGCFVGRNYKCTSITKFSWRRESSWTTSGSRKMESYLVLTERLISRRFCVLPLHSTTYSIQKECRVRHPLSWPIAWYTLQCINDNIKVLVPWKWDRFPEFRPLRKIYLFFILHDTDISRTTWPHGAYRNSEPGQVQGKGFTERILKIWEASLVHDLLISIRLHVVRISL